MLNIPRIQVFRPSMEEMKDFEGYINKIERSGAHKAGLAKIIPPPEWKPRRKDSDYQSHEIDQLVIKAPIQQIVQGRLGLYQQYNIQKKSLTVKEFKKLAENPKYRTPDFFDYEELERKYWKNVTYNPPIYGADVPGSLYDEDVDEFNINRLNTILDLVNESYGIKIMGVNTAYLYFGMWKTTFAWHTEDMDLYSVNYLHFGAPKSWYCVPPEHGKRLERLAAGFFPSSVTSCPAFLRHKMTLISPAILKQYSIPYNKITQEAGEFMVTFPYSYHAGYNHGYNCAESTNFATERWVEYGKRATRCNCRSDSVKISMEAFVKKYQPERYDLWLQGKDIGPHPEDPTHISPAPLPSDYELQVLSKVSKSKRHPPYKPDPEISDAESMDNHCEVVPTFPTKAARKHFETPGPSATASLQTDSKQGFIDNSVTIGESEYLRTSPPNITEAVKRIKHRFTPKSRLTKRSRKSSNVSSTCSIPPESSSTNSMPTNTPPFMSQTPFINQNPMAGPSYLQPNMCTQPTESLIPLTWVAKPGVYPGALQLIDKFLNCDLTSSVPSSATSFYPTNPNFNLSQSVEISSLPYKENSEASASNDDDVPTDLSMKSKTFHSDDLSKLLADETLSRDMREILKRVPVQPYLYQHLPYSFFGEQLFNCYVSSIFPHCSICLIMRKFEIQNDWVDAHYKIPTSSPILIPSAAFAFKVKDDTPNLEDIKCSSLLVCADCKICVHSICYGVHTKLDVDNRANWRCDRCINEDYGVNCCLCPLRGGALKKTKDETKWAHITCALMQPGVTFENGFNKQPIDISGIKKNRANAPLFKCIYCQKTNNKLTDYISGYCIQCYLAPKCSVKFHTTCAYLNGAKFETDDWPDPIRVYCTKCIGKTSGKHLSLPTEDEVELGTIVLAKHKNRRYYEATVMDKTSLILHHAHLEDNSILQILKSSDIVDPDIERTGIPEIGDPITIFWEKTNQAGKYAGNHKSIQYVLKFEDESTIKCSRESFYRLDDEIPLKVQGKRSQATNVRNESAFWAANLKKFKTIINS